MIAVPLWIKLVVIAAVIAAGAAMVNTWGNKHEKIGYDRAVAEYAVKLGQAKDAALVKERAMNKQLEEAQNAATKRDKAKDQRIAALTTTSNGLRHTVSDLRGRLATASIDACRTTADAFATVFEECRGAYEEMGRAADGHASDSLMYQEAWPK